MQLKWKESLIHFAFFLSFSTMNRAMRVKAQTFGQIGEKSRGFWRSQHIVSTTGTGIGSFEPFKETLFMIPFSTALITGRDELILVKIRQANAAACARRHAFWSHDKLERLLDGHDSSPTTVLVGQSSCIIANSSFSCNQIPNRDKIVPKNQPGKDGIRHGCIDKNPK